MNAGMLAAAMTLAVALSQTSCSPNNGNDAGGCSIEAGTTASLTLGSGDPVAPTHFVPLIAGQTVGLAAGSQGSQHVWIQVLGAGICPDHPHAVCTVSLTDTGRIVGTSNFMGSRWTAQVDTPGSYFSVPLACRIEDNEYCALLHGGHVTVHIHVDDGDGRTADAESTVVIDGFTASSDERDIMARESCCGDYTNTTCWPDGAPDGAVTDASDTDGAPDVTAGDAAFDP